MHRTPSSGRPPLPLWRGLAAEPIHDPCLATKPSTSRGPGRPAGQAVFRHPCAVAEPGWVTPGDRRCRWRAPPASGRIAPCRVGGLPADLVDAGAELLVEGDGYQHRAPCPAEPFPRKPGKAKPTPAVGRLAVAGAAARLDLRCQRHDAGDDQQPDGKVRSPGGPPGSSPACRPGEPSSRGESCPVLVAVRSCEKSEKSKESPLRRSPSARAPLREKRGKSSATKDLFSLISLFSQHRASPFATGAVG
jgi:hypothetical protein